MTVTAGGRGVVSHAGSRLLADLADRATLIERVGAQNCAQVADLPLRVGT